VALFREQPREAYVAPKVAPGSPPPVLNAPAPRAGAMAGADAILEESVVASRRAPAAEARLGTGHGEREYSAVVDTEFQRQQAQPNEIIRVRYDSYENLVAMGIIRRPQPARGVPDPFPNSAQRHFVPDPPG
jgi:hypothetical protein